MEKRQLCVLTPSVSELSLIADRPTGKPQHEHKWGKKKDVGGEKKTRGEEEEGSGRALRSNFHFPLLTDFVAERKEVRRSGGKRRRLGKRERGRKECVP